MSEHRLAPLTRSLRWLGRPSAGRLWQGLALLALLATVILLIQDYYGLPFKTTIPVGPSDRITSYRQSTGTYRWRLPSRYNNQVMNYRAVVLEDGRPLTRCIRSKDVADIRAASYYIHNSVVLFGSGDGSDVRSNGKRYEVRLPRHVRTEWLIVALGVLTLSGTMAARTSSSQRPWRSIVAKVPHLPAWGLGIGVLTILVGDLIWQSDRTLGAMLVKGLPESDSAGWYDLGQRLAEGLGLDNHFGSQRPFYAIYLAALSLVGGPSLFVAKVFNALLTATAATGAYMIGRAMRRAWAGLGAAAYLTLSDDHLNTMHSMLTETPGLTFGVLSALTLIWALWKRSLWGCILAGIVTGIGCLSSGELLLTVPFFAILIASLGVFRQMPLKRSLVLTAAFTLATSLTLLPWMCLQKARHGIFTLTMNTPDLLCGGSDPTHGKLDWKMQEEAKIKGLNENNIAGRYRYFSERFASNVKADPLGYLRRVLNATRESLGDVRSNDPMARLLIPLAVLGTGLLGTLRWRAPQPMILAGALLLYLANEDDPWPAPWLSLLPLALITERWRGRRMIALWTVLATVLACMLLCGLAGNVASRRFWNVADWGLVLLWLVGASSLLRLIFKAVSKVPLLRAGMATSSRDVEFRQTSGRLCDCPIMAYTWIAISIAALGLVLIRHQQGPLPLYQANSVATALAVPIPAESTTMLVKFDDFTMTLGRWELVPHWRPYYYPSKESRWLARPRKVMPDGTLGSRVNVEAALSLMPPPPSGKTALCIGTILPLTDPITNSAVHVLRVTELQPVELKLAP